MKTLSTHAEAAKAIRNELKQKFPLIKFSVKSRSFAGGDSIDINWIDGPSREMVVKITGKYQYGNFDGMTDCYNYSNTRNDIPQVKYVFERREVSEKIMQDEFEKCKESYAGWENLSSLDECSQELMKIWSHWTAREYINRKLREQDLTNVT
jgi:hypothetical protein